MEKIEILPNNPAAPPRKPAGHPPLAGLCTRAVALSPCFSSFSRGDATAEALELPWVLATEQPARVFDWQRGAVIDEILLIDGLSYPETIPLLDSHSRVSAADVLGSVRILPGAQQATGKMRQLMGAVRFSEASALARETRQKVLEGHITDGSIGYRVLESVWIPENDSARINGRIYNGPVKISTAAQIIEFSIVPIGADSLAKLANPHP